MFNIYEKFRRDEKRSNDGAPMVIGKSPEGEDVIIYVKRVHPSNVQFKTFTDNAKRQAQFALEHGTDDEKSAILEDIVTNGVQHVCVTGWSPNMCDSSGNLIAFTPEAVQRIRTDLPELFDMIIAFGSDSSNYVGSFNEDQTVKN